MSIKPLSNQVGGHDSTMFVEKDQSILLKLVPPHSQEVLSYQNFQTRCTEYIPHLPKFYGTKTIDGKLFLMMENLVSRYRYPCILDIKIGTKAYAPDASDRKKEVQSEKARITTGLSLGIRIVGMKKFDPLLGHFVSFTKSFGAKIGTREKVAAAFQTFFSVLSPSSEEPIPSLLRQRICSEFDESGMEQRPKFEVVRTDIVKSVVSQLQSLHDFLASTPPHRFNIYSSSLLIAFDGAPSEPSSQTMPGLPPTIAPPVVKMIDMQHVFEKFPGSVVENEDDGYLFGVYNTISILKEFL